MPETHFDIAVRKGLETDIVDSFNKKDMGQMDVKLDIWPAGHERPPLTDADMFQQLEGKQVQRFFKPRTLEGIGVTALKEAA